RLLLANVTSLITYMDVNVKRQAYAYRMLVMKSTVAVYINYKWHKFCLVNSQLAGAHTVTILGIVVVFTLLYCVLKYMGHSTELVQSQVGYILNIFMFYSQNVVPIYIVPYLKYTYLVNEPSIFILYFQNVLECFSSPKNCHYRNIVINYSKKCVKSKL